MSDGIQGLLACRRALINEQRREPDQMTRAVLQYEIGEIDRAIAKHLDARAAACGAVRQ